MIDKPKLLNCYQVVCSFLVVHILPDLRKRGDFFVRAIEARIAEKDEKGQAGLIVRKSERKVRLLVEYRNDVLTSWSVVVTPGGSGRLFPGHVGAMLIEFPISHGAEHIAVKTVSENGEYTHSIGTIPAVPGVYACFAVLTLSQVFGV